MRAMRLTRLPGRRRPRRVTVWEWTGPAADEGDAAAAWLTSFLGRPARLVRYLGTSDAAARDAAAALAADAVLGGGGPAGAEGAAGALVRPVDPEFVPWGAEVAFAGETPEGGAAASGAPGSTAQQASVPAPRGGSRGSRSGLRKRRPLTFIPTRTPQTASPCSSRPPSRSPTSTRAWRPAGRPPTWRASGQTSCCPAAARGRTTRPARSASAAAAAVIHPAAAGTAGTPAAAAAWRWRW
jgi:hypothetical protein